MIFRRCQIPEWRERALRHAHSLKGRENTQVENDFIATHPDPWDFFYIFGLDATRQRYIDITIEQIERCDNIADQVICEIRLEWSTRELKGIKQGKHETRRTHRSNL